MATRALLEGLGDGDVRGFRGLPPDTRVTDLVPDFSPADGGWGQATLGREHRSARFVIRALATGRPLRVWFDTDSRVLLADIDYPGVLLAPPELARELGEPTALLDAANDLFAHLRERVYAARGLSLIADPDDRFLVRIVAFAPTTADDYVRRLRINP